MGLLSVVAALILFVCIGQMKPAVGLKIPTSEFDTKPQKKSEKFNLLISEKGVKFQEKIEINEEKDVQYFKVPPHNGLAESDNMYDFKMNITVSRAKKDQACYISPLPSDLPRPKVLSKGLKKLSNLPQNIKKISQQWRVGDIVDKKTLRAEVQDFCRQFSVYRLEPFTTDSVSVMAGNKGDTRPDRTRRQGLKDFPLCNNNIPQCDPSKWVFSCKIRTARCVYYVQCNLDQANTIVSCSTLTTHLYTSIVCCTPTCT